MNSFSFTIPQNIVVGAGSLKRLPELAKNLKKSKAYIISGPHLEKIGMVDKCREALKAAGIESDAFTQTEGNPSTDTVAKAAEGFKSSKADFIVAFGGGSPLDVAKAVAVISSYGGNITDYEGGGKVPGPVVPMIAIPTTAGTGSEVSDAFTQTEGNPQLYLKAPPLPAALTQWFMHLRLLSQRLPPHFLICLLRKRLD